jgi:hypothetical protein
MLFMRGVIAMARRRGRRTIKKNVAFGGKPRYARALSNVIACATNLMWSKYRGNDIDPK